MNTCTGTIHLYGMSNLAEKGSPLFTMFVASIIQTVNKCGIHIYYFQLNVGRAVEHYVHSGYIVACLLLIVCVHVPVQGTYIMCMGCPTWLKTKSNH